MAVDIVHAKVDMINNHEFPIQDDHIEKYFAEICKKELNLTAATDAKAAHSDEDFVVIAAPTNYDSNARIIENLVSVFDRLQIKMEHKSRWNTQNRITNIAVFWRHLKEWTQSILDSLELLPIQTSEFVFALSLHNHICDDLRK